jgi:RNA polymerase sigma factor (sigma-70 family)
MDTTLDPDALMREQNNQVAETVTRERGRLSNFIRRRVADPAEAEDILQDVFFAFVEAYRLPDPVEQVGAWLFRVARNRIIDRFRKKRSEPLVAAPSDTDEEPWLETVLPSPDAGPEAAYARKVLLEELYAALDDLPEPQRAVFIAHEVEGRSFKTLAAESGVPLNTLLARKRYAVRHLRARLQTIYDEFDLY